MRGLRRTEQSGAHHRGRCIWDTLVSMGIAPTASIWRMPPPPRRRIWPFPLRSSGGRKLLRRWLLPPTISHQLGRCMGVMKDGLTPYSLGCASIWMLGPCALGQGGRRSAVYGRDRRTVMELCFTGTSSKSIPAKAAGTSWRKVFFRHAGASRASEVLKNGDHHRAGHPSGFPAHPFRPVGESGPHFSTMAKPLIILHRFSGPFRWRSDFSRRM